MNFFAPILDNLIFSSYLCTEKKQRILAPDKRTNPNDYA